MSIIVRLSILATSALLTGCAASTSRGDNWTYVGADPVYRNPPLMPRGSMTTEAWQLDIQQKMQEWHRRNREEIEKAKQACAGEGSDFSACMKARGWARASNPA
ncbi:MAG: hypothetical protein WCO67_19810 [Betaproteobacteria bacterium]